MPPACHAPLPAIHPACHVPPPHPLPAIHPACHAPPRHAHSLASPAPAVLSLLFTFSSQKCPSFWAMPTRNCLKSTSKSLFLLLLTHSSVSNSLCPMLCWHSWWDVFLGFSRESRGGKLQPESKGRKRSRPEGSSYSAFVLIKLQLIGQGPPHWGGQAALLSLFSRPTPTRTSSRNIVTDTPRTMYQVSRNVDT